MFIILCEINIIVLSMGVTFPRWLSQVWINFFKSGSVLTVFNNRGCYETHLRQDWGTHSRRCVHCSLFTLWANPRLLVFYFISFLSLAWKAQGGHVQFVQSDLIKLPVLPPDTKEREAWTDHIPVLGWVVFNKFHKPPCWGGGHTAWMKEQPEEMKK